MLELKSADTGNVILVQGHTGILNGRFWKFRTPIHDTESVSWLQGHRGMPNGGCWNLRALIPRECFSVAGSHRDAERRLLEPQDQRGVHDLLH